MITEATRKKMREARLGVTPWNKGLRTGFAPWRGKKRPDIAGSKNVNWKGNAATYSTIHTWLKNNLGKASICVECGTKNAKRYEWANISGEYKREFSDYKSLCSVCHHRLDNIATRGWVTKKGGASQFAS